MSIEDEIRRLYKPDAQLEDVVSILYGLLTRIQMLEIQVLDAKLKETKQ